MTKLEQDMINKIAQLQIDCLQHKMYGYNYLKKTDGSIVILTPEGTEMPLPKSEDYDYET